MSEAYDHLRYLIDSESVPEHKYLVDLLSGACDCMDWQCKPAEEKQTYRCKHYAKALPIWAEEALTRIRNQNPNA